MQQLNQAFADLAAAFDLLSSFRKIKTWLLWRKTNDVSDVSACFCGCTTGRYFRWNQSGNVEIFRKSSSHTSLHLVSASENTEIQVMSACHNCVVERNYVRPSLGNVVTLTSVFLYLTVQFKSRFRVSKHENKNHANNEDTRRSHKDNVTAVNHRGIK